MGGLRGEHIYISIYIYIYAHPPNGPTAGGIRVLARSREQQQNKKLTKNKKPKNQKKQKNQKKHLFQNYGGGASKKLFFWFSRGKNGFFVRNHFFLEKKMVFGGLLLVKPSFSLNV